MNYAAAKTYILRKLKHELSDKLYYHGVHHTLDVLAVAEDLCRAQKRSAHETQLVKTAALYHDAGFLFVTQGHEAVGCEMAREILPRFDYKPDDVEQICGMIMATKIPQSPQNELEEILCDADLDYLGRSDFYHIGATLFAELRAYGVLQHEEEWNRIQVAFLENHTFFTDFNRVHRTPLKLQHLAELKAVVASY
ncbi:MAG: HD domain-containing protein [Bacteroidetes bacterium]|nr:MAG: HD domain-containing protein [Bacteroidota bacterium]